MVSYPTSVWDGDSGNRDSDDGFQASPDHRDWDRVIAEVAAAQGQVNANQAGVAYPANATHTVGAVTTKTGLSLVEYGDAAIHKTVFTFASMAMASTDGAVPASDGAWGSQELYTFPEGQLLFIGAQFVSPLAGLIATTGGGTGFSDTSDFGIGVGTVAAANSTEFGLSTTEEDIIAEIDCDLTAATSDAIESGVNGTAAVHDGTAGAIAFFLNYRTLDDADHGAVADILTVNGTLTLLWSVLGDD